MLTHGVDNSALLLTLLNESFLAISKTKNRSQLQEKDSSSSNKKINKFEGTNYPYSWDENACRPQNMI